MTPFRENADDTVMLLREFTDTYKNNSSNKYLREAYCYRVQWKSMMCDIKAQDLFAGRTQLPMIGFIPQSNESMGYYIHQGALDDFRKRIRYRHKADRILNEITEFWRTENTVSQSRKAYTGQMKEALPSDRYNLESGIAFTLWRMSGIQMDYEKLVRLGIPGLRQEIIGKQSRVEPDIGFLESLSGHAGCTRHIRRSLPLLCRPGPEAGG